MIEVIFNCNIVYCKFNNFMNAELDAPALILITCIEAELKPPRR